MMRIAAVLMLTMWVANVSSAAGRAANAMRVITLPAAGAAVLGERLAALDADIAISASRRTSAIVSRHRIIDLREVELGQAARAQDRCVALVARIAQPGVPNGVYAVAARLGDAGGAISPADAMALARLVSSLPGPVIIAGDLAPMTQNPLADALVTAPDAGAEHVFSTSDLPARAAFVQPDPRGTAAVADLALHPAIPVLPVRRAALDADLATF